MQIEPPSLRGNAALLAHSPSAFFCSQFCPGDIILKAQDWANAHGQESAPVIGGFHTPVERDALRILLRTQAPVIIVPARSIKGWRAPGKLGPAIRDGVKSGRVRLVSPFPETQRRTTAASSETRNRYIIGNCKEIMIAHASPEGKTEQLAIEAISRGLNVLTLQSASNSNLLKLGAKVAPQ